MKLKNLLLVIVALLFTACGLGNKAVVDGKFFGNGNTQILIEQVVPGGNPKFIDTMTTDDEGVFSFQYEFEDENPVFINVRTVDSYVPLLLAPGEKVELSAVGNIYNNYKVKGSEGSETLHSLNMSTIAQIRALDSLMNIYNGSSDPETSQRIGKEYSKRYVDLKRSVIRFVITNPHSLAAIVPLYQPIVGGRYIFDEPTDIVYFRAVADSLYKRYPTSPHVVSLRADLERSGRTFAMDSLLKSGVEIEETALPPLQLKDAEGQLRKLSDLAGKVVLLDFTSILIPELKVRNAELAEIYNKYSGQGFEIYQVSIDDNRAAWLTAVVDARIRWISVNDLQGQRSPALAAFNVESIPASFLIDRSGNIVARDFKSPEELERSIVALL